MDKVTIMNQKKNSTRLEVEEKLASYKFSLQASNRRSKTISWYMDILRDFFSKYEKINEQLKPMHEFNREDLRVYIRHLQNSTKWPNRQPAGKDYGKLSPYTIQGKVRAIKAYWGWLLKEEYIDGNPYAGFTLPKVPQNLVKTITPEQFNRYISFIDRSTPEGFMYFLLLLLIFYITHSN